MLKFSPENAKTQALYDVYELMRYLQYGQFGVYSLDLLAGHTCPFARECHSRVVNGKIKDGEHCRFRCFAASMEVRSPNTLAAHKHNTKLLRRKRTMEGMANLIYESMPEDMGVCRIHVSGDFFSELYMKAWAWVAVCNPDRLFYAYTKSLPYWINLRKKDMIPPNFKLTASYGGTHDHLIKPYKLPSAKVVFSESEAYNQGLEIDHDDSHAANPTVRDFALLLHGTQPAGSPASAALVQLQGRGSYSR